MNSKIQLRQSLRQARRKLTANKLERERLSQLAQSHILASPAWLSAQRLLLYMALPDEVSCAQLVSAARQGGKEIYLPRCLEEPGQMALLAWPENQDLELSAKGLWEPLPDNKPLGENLAQTLIIVPGLAFDRRGGRLGYGGGYYDRVLAQPHGPALGLAFSLQLVAQLPLEAWDIPLDGLATEDSLLWF